MVWATSGWEADCELKAEGLGLILGTAKLRKNPKLMIFWLQNHSSRASRIKMSLVVKRASPNISY